MDEHQRQCAAAACRDTILRTAVATDAGDAAALAALFTEDAVLVRPSGQALHGRAAIEQAYAQRPPERITRHLVTNTIVDLPDADHAQAHSLVLVWSGSSTDAAGPQGRPAAPRQLLGEFHDQLVRTAQGWRIAHRRAVFVLHSQP